MKNLGYTLLALSTVGVLQTANAELRDAADFEAAGFVFTPKLSASVGYDDNITTAPSDELSANVYKLAPELEAKTEFGDFLGLTLNTKGEKGVFSGEGFNNYYDYSFGTELIFRLTSKQSLDFFYDYSRGHDPAGSPSATSDGIEEFRVNKGGLIYNLGNNESIARLELGLNAEGKRYRQAAASTKDFDADQIDAKGFFTVAPKTDVFLQVVGTEYDYLNNADSLDNDDTRVFLGVQWQATAKTSGSAKIGNQEKEFTERSPEVETDETVWEVGVKWEPKSYSAFNVGLSREIDNGNGNDVARTEDAVDRLTASLGWEHKWNDDLKTNIGARFVEDEYLGSNIAREGIEAETVGFNAGLEFQVERNFTISMNYSYTDKTADVPSNATANLRQIADDQEFSQNSAVVFGVEIGL